MRRLEVALIEYRESLEEQGMKNSEEFERKVAVHRKRLESEYGLSSSNEDVTGNSKWSFCKTESLRKHSASYDICFHVLC